MTDFNNTKKNIKKILIVDDEKALANALAVKFKSSGFEAKSVYNGGEVFNEIKTNDYDIILLDLLMPVVDGWSVLEQLNDKNLKIIITSNLSQVEDIQRAKQLGATGFIVKSENSLTEIVDKVQEF